MWFSNYIPSQTNINYENSSCFDDLVMNFAILPCCVINSAMIYYKDTYDKDILCLQRKMRIAYYLSNTFFKNIFEEPVHIPNDGNMVILS